MRHILKSLEFANIIKSGKKAKGKMLSVYVQQSQKGKDLAVGCVISKRVASLSVKRNYIRRLIYAYFRGNKQLFKQGAEIVVRLERNISGQKKKSILQEVREELSALTGKAGIRK